MQFCVCFEANYPRTYGVQNLHLGIHDSLYVFAILYTFPSFEYCGVNCYKTTHYTALVGGRVKPFTPYTVADKVGHCHAFIYWFILQPSTDEDRDHVLAISMTYRIKKRTKYELEAYSLFIDLRTSDCFEYNSFPFPGNSYLEGKGQPESLTVVISMQNAILMEFKPQIPFQS